MSRQPPTVPTPAELIETLQNRIADPARKAQVAALGAQLTVLTMQHMLTGGKDERIERDLAHIKSQLASLSATETFVIREVTTAWLTRFVNAVIVAALS